MVYTSEYLLLGPTTIHGAAELIAVPFWRLPLETRWSLAALSRGGQLQAAMRELFCSKSDTVAKR